MAAIKQSPYDLFLDQVVARMTPDQILAYQLPDDEQEHVDELLDRNNDGELTATEKVELQDLLQFERLMSRLKARAALLLSQP